MAVACSRAWQDCAVGPHKENHLIQRRTQTTTYWQDEFDFAGKGVGYVYDLILDRAEPVSTAALAQVLIKHHVQREEEAIRTELGSSRFYQPKDEYQVGEKLVFPALDFVRGTVEGTRPGKSRSHGDFAVLQVRMERGDEIREFASAVDGDHALNRQEGEDDLLLTDDLLSVDKVYEACGSFVEEKLVATLAEHDEFIQYKDGWFLRGLLAPIHAGQLNIAEALIEVKGRPLPTAEFLTDLDLPSEVPEQVQMLSVNYALEGDERFDNIGDSGRDIWYLRRLAPEPVVDPPARLVLATEPYDRQEIDQELLLIEREIDDEGSGEEVFGPGRQIYRTTTTLIYPHWRCGTLPLTARTWGLFPQATNHHTPIVLVDGQTGERMQGWIVHGSSFIYGLKDWYERYRLPVGALIKLERTRDPRAITVDFESQRLKHQWLKVATVEGGKLVFQMRKGPISCGHDELLTIGEDDVAAIDGLWVEVNASGEGLLQIMIGIIPELIKLSSQHTVHAKTIYSAVNVLKRVPPGPVFALLSTEPCFVSMGGGYWTFDEALIRPGAK